MRQPIESRFEVFRAMVKRPWVSVVGAIIFALGLYDLVVAQILPLGWAVMLPRLYDIGEGAYGWLPWWGWLLLVMGLITTASVEYTFRLRKTEKDCVQEDGRKACLDRLSYKMEDGSRLLNRPVANEEELRAWKNSYDKWTEDTYGEIENYYSRAQAVSFKAVGSVQAAVMLPNFNEWHNGKKLRLYKRMGNLKSFIDANSILET